MTKELIKRIFENLPVQERGMPAIVVEGKVLTWEQLWKEVRDNGPLADKIQHEFEEMRKYARERK